jgi:DNA polymerase-3 subunit epsilon
MPVPLPLSLMTQETLYNTPLTLLPYSVVDLETTGSRPGINQIIEIGIVRIENGKIVDTYQTFINPGGEHIPQFIQNMTGITDADVENAPILPDIAPRFLPLLQDSVFVAHNAAFDYTFLTKNLKLAGFEFSAPKICTVQLSRKLLPQLYHHTLDDLAHHFHIQIPNRHRALDDAIATGKSLLQMFTMLVDSGKQFFGALADLSSPPETKKYKLLKDTINALPFSPGVYYMKDKDGQIIYVGKSKCLQKRVRSYFYGSKNKTKKLEKLVETVQTIEHEKAGSELSALLLESKRIKEHLPIFNTMIRNYKSYPFLKISNEAFPRIYSVREVCADGATYYGPFKSSGMLQETIENLQKTFKLRPCKGKINPTKPESMKLCMYYELGECPGVCGGKMSQDEYATIVQNAKIFLEGNSRAFITKLQAEIDSASENLQYEKAAELRDQLLLLERMLEKQERVTKSVRDNNVVIVENGLDRNIKEVFCIKNGIVQKKLIAETKSRNSLQTTLYPNELDEITFNDDVTPLISSTKKIVDEDNRELWKDTLSQVYTDINESSPITKQNLDDLMIISTWLMQHKEKQNIYFISPHNLDHLAEQFAENFSLRF